MNLASEMPFINLQKKEAPNSPRENKLLFRTAEVLIIDNAYVLYNATV